MSDKLSKRSQSTELQNLLIVDPNPCGSSVINVEDLSISVELEVFRRTDDIIIFDNSSGEATQQTNGTDDDTTRISFIDGSGEQKELTTSYTELNTRFNRDNPELQTLGIESIDISFNTSYVPIVKIRFKDIRGKLFEMGPDSPYGFLFRMPYPIFYLTVKGYYGKPVKYALHLTKFNGSLDSETGSFLITCDFIGYTYAFLSDLLMGYIRAIPFTERGRNLIANQFDNFIDFEQLQKVITELNDFISKFKKDDNKLKALTIYGDLESKLDAISGQLKAQLTTLENRRTFSDTENIVYVLASQNLTSDFINDYNTNILSIVDEYNQFTKSTNADSFLLDRKKFELDSTGVYYKKFQIDDFIRKRLPAPDGNVNIGTSGAFRDFKTVEQFQENPDKIKDKYKNFILTGNEEDDNSIKKLYKQFTDTLSKKFIASDGRSFTASDFNMLDIRFGIQQIDDARERINEELINNKNLVSEEFLDKLSEFFKEQGIDYDGSIGALFRILCRHVDLFIATIRDLGIAIKKDIDGGNRTIQGSNKENFTESQDDNNNSTITIRAFPEYVEKIDGALTEKWMGGNPKFKDFKEVLFIDDLLNSIIKAEQKDQEFILNTNQQPKGWYPVNPLETKAVNSSNTNPWLIPGNKVEIYSSKLLLQRMVLFLAYTNSNLTPEEVEQMAKIEARQMYDAIPNADVRKGVINDNTQITGGPNSKITSELRQVASKFNLGLLDDEDEANVDYRHSTFDLDNGEFGEDNNATYIPITQSLSQLEDSNNTLDILTNRSTTNEIFVSSVVSNALANEDVPNEEEFETFITIIDPTKYTGNFSYLYDSDLDVSSITKNFKDGVNISEKNSLFGGTYRTHEFLIYEDEKAGQIPLYYDFYEDGKDKVNSFRNESESEYDTFIEDGGAFLYNTNTRVFENRDDINSFFENTYDNKTFKGQLIDNYTNGDEVSRTFKFQPTFSSQNTEFSLFGSEFYYQQNVTGRALLFLHTLPFRGMGGPEIRNGNQTIDRGLLQGKDINYFNQRGGFVSVPYAWILFMGGLLYRESQENDILTFNDADGETFLPKIDGGIFVDKNNYLIGTNIQLVGQSSSNVIQGSRMSFNKNYSNNIRINNVISRLPQSVKDEFMLAFENWVNNDWEVLRTSLEIFPDGSSQANRNAVWNDFGSNVNLLRETVGVNYYVVSNDVERNNFVLDIRDGSDASNDVIDLLFERRIIVNSTYRIWQGLENRFEEFIIPSSQVVAYLTAFYTEFKTLNTQQSIDREDETKKTLFNTNNDEDIKLSLYKNIKSIYDKWIVGIPKGKEGVLVTDLYERFSFIDRAYIDISDKFKIAPTTFVNYWKDNTNISFYNFIARILSSNNFDFIPLPTFINYGDKEAIRDVFEPFRFNEAPRSEGPQFICMYFGEQSNKLNIDKDNQLKKNDSWSLDVRCNGDNITVNNSSELPDDFVSGSTRVPYVLVNYADQNQSIFKSFKLDQSEFTETQESLEIIEALSTQNRNNSIGQNLFDIYNNRAYSCEVEMLGCAQIQPFMYFQLNNIPMFDGAYNIINTTHSIKPNHMTTTFKGVRIRAVKTKMIDDKTLYAHLINNLNEVSKEGASLESIQLENGDAPVVTPNIEPAIIEGAGINGQDEVRITGIIIEE